MWMEGLDRITPGVASHSGSRCVGMELIDITKSRRNEFVISHLDQNPLVDDELFISVWLYLPADWRLHLKEWNWYEIANPFNTGEPNFLPYSSIHIHQPNNLSDTFNLAFEITNGSGKITLKEIPKYSLPRGRWFNLQYYILCHETNGIMRIWIDGELLFDGNNIPTKNPSVAEWFTVIAKIYYEKSDTFSPYQIWVDDLEIWSANPHE